MSNYYTDQISEWCAGQWLGRRAVDSILGFSNDTRTIEQGFMFVALVTEQRDGHDFLHDAESNGAAAALVSRYIEDCALPQLLVDDTLKAFQDISSARRREFSGTVVGITGSCGKTSTKDLLKSMLGNDTTHSTVANLNNFLGVPLTLVGLDSSRHSSAVVELGINQSGEMKTLARLVAPDIAVFTMVGNAHLEKLGSIEKVAEEKAHLGASVHKDGCVIFPHTCCEYPSFHNFSARSIILVPEGEDVQLEFKKNVVSYSIKSLGNGSQINLRMNTASSHSFDIPMCSPGMASNISLAITCALLMDVKHEHIQESLLQWTPSRHRGEEILCGEQVFYVDCYNANPDSFADAFKHFSTYDPTQNRLYVLGCMNELGARSEDLHYITGQQLQLRDQDRAIIVGKEAISFQKGIIEAGSRSAQVQIVSGLEEIHQEIRDFSGCILLKGSRTYRLEDILPEVSRDTYMGEVAC